jgi:hypothetical protein
LLSKPHLPLHCLLQIRGFLIYVVRTYKWLNPYIKGLHLTIDSWRTGRAANGFKLKGKELKQAMALWVLNRELDFALGGRHLEKDVHASTCGDQKQPADAPPGVVQPVDHFRRDLTCLMELTSPATPPPATLPCKTHDGILCGGGCKWQCKGGGRSGVTWSFVRGRLMECGIEEQVFQCTRGGKLHRLH